MNVLLAVQEISANRLGLLVVISEASPPGITVANPLIVLRRPVTSAQSREINGMPHAEPIGRNGTAGVQTVKSIAAVE
jgi:hypothetical protein